MLAPTRVAQLAATTRVPFSVDEATRDSQFIANPGGIGRQAMKSFQLVTCGGSTALGLIACASSEVTHREDAPCIAAWDWDVHHLVLYRDADHPGWYVAFNTRLGISFHVMFL